MFITDAIRAHMPGLSIGAPQFIDCFKTFYIGKAFVGPDVKCSPSPAFPACCRGLHNFSWTSCPPGHASPRRSTLPVSRDGEFLRFLRQIERVGSIPTPSNPAGAASPLDGKVPPDPRRSHRPCCPRKRATAGGPRSATALLPPEFHCADRFVDGGVRERQREGTRFSRRGGVCHRRAGRRAASGRTGPA